MQFVTGMHASLCLSQLLKHCMLPFFKGCGVPFVTDYLQSDFEIRTVTSRAKFKFPALNACTVGVSGGVKLLHEKLCMP